MKRNRILVGVVAALVALVAATAALAAGPNGKVLYRFVGQLQSPPAGTSLTVTVQGGNRHALHAMLGQGQTQVFATGEKTVFLKWAKGIPAVVAIGDLAQGDHVAVNIRAPRGASLAEVLATQAGTVGDHGQTWNRPTKPLYLFRGTLVSAGNGSVTVDVKGGNRHALRLMIGQPARQTFATGEETVFLHWEGRIPTVTQASSLEVGGRVIVRIRADRGSTLAQVGATAAKRVAEHEPPAQESAQSAQS
jgi:hypothetical protein